MVQGVFDYVEWMFRSVLRMGWYYDYGWFGSNQSLRRCCVSRIGGGSESSI